MSFLRTVLEHQPLAALFLTIAIGYLIGEINLKGFSLGVGAVLFVALGMGCLAPNATPPPMVGTLGLALFLYAVGIQYGKQFFAGWTTAKGLKINLIALTGVLLSGGVCLLFVKTLRVPLGHGVGLFAGSGTSTPALQAAIATLGNDDPAVGYSVSYPFGVAGPILLLYLASAVFKPKVKAPATNGLEVLEIAISNSALFGKRVGELGSLVPAGVQIAALRRAHRNEPATPGTVLAQGDVVLAVSASRAALETLRDAMGVSAPGEVAQDRRDLDYLRVFASHGKVVGRALSELTLPGHRASIVIQVRRGDTDLEARPELVLERGDRVGLLAAREDFPAMRAYFGDSIKGTAEFSYISIGVGMALGFLLGAIEIPIPGGAKIALGLSGVLIVALILGRMRRAAGLSWTIPLSANLVLRNLGLTLFLAQVGMSSGPKFAATVAQTGFQMLGLGMVALAALVLPILLLGMFVLKLPFDEVAGVVAGACGNPAILGYANKLTPTEAPDIGYAMIFPGMTILKILFVDIVPTLF